MAIRRISPERWREELESFSRQHEGWLASLSVRDSTGEVKVQAADLPLVGVSPASPGSTDIAIALGKGPSQLTHDVRDAAGLGIELTSKGAERALLIYGADGDITSLEFKSPLPAEQVDGPSGPPSR